MSEHKKPKDLETDPSIKVVEKPKPAEVPKRRVKMLMVKPGEFMFLFTKGLRFQKNFKVVKGVPDDAKLITVVPDSIRNGIMLVVQSSEYPEVPMNVLPEVEMVDIDLDGIKNPTKKKVVPKRKRK